MEERTRDEIGGIVEAIKFVLTPRYSLALWLTGLAIFVLDGRLPYLDKFTLDYGKFIAPIFVLALCAWAVQTGWTAIMWFWTRRERFKRGVACIDGDLSDGQACFLYDALDRRRRSHVLLNDEKTEDDEEALELWGEDVLVRLPGKGVFQIDERIWKHLNANGNREKYLSKWKPQADRANAPNKVT